MKLISAVFPATYLAVCALQSVAIYSGAQDWLGLHWLVAGVISLVAGYLPVIGTIAAVCGAVSAWQLHWAFAVALFLGPLAVSFFFVFAAYTVTKKTNPY